MLSYLLSPPHLHPLFFLPGTVAGGNTVTNDVKGPGQGLSQTSGLGLEESGVFESLKSLSSLAKTPMDYRKRKQLRRAAKKYSKAIVSPHEGLQYLRAMEALKFIRMELESSTWLYDVSFGAETIDDIYGKTIKPIDVTGKTSHLKPMYTQDLATVIPSVVVTDKEALEDELNAREELEAAKDGLTEV